jgi:hypothetical protein
MSLIGSYPSKGIDGISGNVFSESVVNFTGFRPSGISNGNLLGVALYVWSGSTTEGKWWPLRREWL